MGNIQYGTMVAFWLCTLSFAQEIEENSTGSVNVSSGVEGYRRSTITTGYVMTIVHTVIGSIGLIGNGLVLIVVPSSKSLRRRTTNKIIINQSFIDLMASLFLIIGTLIEDINMVPEGRPSELFCTIWMSKYLYTSFMYCSSANIIFLTLQKYCQIFCLNFHKLLFSGILLAFTILAPYIFGFSFISYHLVDTRMNGNICYVHRVTSITDSSGVLALMITQVTLIVVIPMLSFIICYGRLIHYLYHIDISGLAGNQPNDTLAAQRNDTITAEQDTDRRDHIPSRVSAGQKYTTPVNKTEALSKARISSIRTLITVACAYVVCWLPVEVYYVMANLGHPATKWASTGVTKQVLFGLVTCNIVVNPIIYAVQHSEFQGALKQLCCKSSSAADRNINVTEEDGNDSTVAVTTL